MQRCGNCGETAHNRRTCRGVSLAPIVWESAHDEPPVAPPEEPAPAAPAPPQPPPPPPPAPSRPPRIRRSDAELERERGLILAALAEEPLSTVAIALRTSLRPVYVYHHLSILIASGRVEPTGHRKAPSTRYRLSSEAPRARRHPPKPPVPPESSARALPVLQLGPGERDSECRHYDGCLDRFVRTHALGRRFVPGAWKEPEAHCPEGCAHREGIPREAALELACVGRFSAIAEASR